MKYIIRSGGQTGVKVILSIMLLLSIIGCRAFPNNNQPTQAPGISLDSESDPVTSPNPEPSSSLPPTPEAEDNQTAFLLVAEEDITYVPTPSVAPPTPAPTTTPTPTEAPTVEPAAQVEDVDTTESSALAEFEQMVANSSLPPYVTKGLFYPKLDLARPVTYGSVLEAQSYQVGEGKTAQIFFASRTDLGDYELVFEDAMGDVALTHELLIEFVNTAGIQAINPDTGAHEFHSNPNIHHFNLVFDLRVETDENGVMIPGTDGGARKFINTSGVEGDIAKTVGLIGSNDDSGFTFILKDGVLTLVFSQESDNYYDVISRLLEVMIKTGENKPVEQPHLPMVNLINYIQTAFCDASIIVDWEIETRGGVITSIRAFEEKIIKTQANNPVFRQIGDLIHPDRKGVTIPILKLVKRS